MAHRTAGMLPAGSPARLFGAELRIARDHAGLSLAGLADKFRAAGRVVHRGYLANADAIASDVLSGDPRRVATEQTSHALDLAIAALIAADGLHPNPLKTWISGAPDPVLRVNAAGIAAKMSGSDTAESAVTALATDPAMRHRYLTAVVSRVLHIPWSKARQHTAEPCPGHHVTAASVDRLRTELHNEHDAGARWCTAYLLAGVWATPEHPGNASAATALETALADEPLPTLRTAYGRALSRKTLVG